MEAQLEGSSLGDHLVTLEFQGSARLVDLFPLAEDQPLRRIQNEEINHDPRACAREDQKQPGPGTTENQSKVRVLAARPAPRTGVRKGLLRLGLRLFTGRDRSHGGSNRLR